MLRPRIVPCLLISSGGLVKTKGFKAPRYVGDPINAVKIFNEKQVDELIVLDIDATVMGVEPNYGLIEKMAQECRMPLCYGGGISNSSQAFRIIQSGVEKVSLGASAILKPDLLEEISAGAGSQSVVAVLDVRKRKGIFSNGYQAFTHNGKIPRDRDPLEIVADFQRAGAGEIIVNFIDKDGEMSGYDLDLARLIVKKVRVPTTFLGGAGSIDHMIELVSTCGIVGVAAGSFFVFKGNYRAVLINYPSQEQRDQITFYATRKFR